MGTQKAWAAALVTLIAVPLAMFGVGDMPAPQTVSEALIVLLSAGVPAVVAWIGTYATRNKTKGGLRASFGATLAALALALLMVGVGCAPPRALATAQTPAQKAFALYGVFVAMEEAGAAIVTNELAPEIIKRAIRRADAMAKPTADAMLAGARRYQQLKRQLDTEPTDMANVTVIALHALLAQIAEAEPKINALVGAVRAWKGQQGDPS